MKNDDKLRDQMTSAPVPDSLKPENIKIMLDEKAPKKKRSGITVAGRLTAAAAACAVIGGTAAYTMNNGKSHKFNESQLSDEKKQDTTAADADKENEPEIKKQASYMSGASDYGQVYELFRDASKKAEKKYQDHKFSAAINGDNLSISEESAFETNSFDDISSVNGELATSPAGGYASGTGGEEPFTPEAPILQSEPDNEGEPETETPTEFQKSENDQPDDEGELPDENELTEDSDPEHSDTYDQEKGVLEADIVKTDGKHIYYVTNSVDENYNAAPLLRVANAENGKFTGSCVVNISDALGGTNNFSLQNMYVYNDMIIVIGSSDNYAVCYDDSDIVYSSGSPYSFAVFYTTGDEPQLIDVYTQKGYFNDVRISPDGYMLMISNMYTKAFSNISDPDCYEEYIPDCGFSESCKLLPAEDILLPDGGFGSSDILNYSVITSIDLNQSGVPQPKDQKALAGHTGSIYCSADNLYAAAYNADDYSCTDITRISISGGEIVPMSGTTIEGYVKDQFSMSEFDGFFRVAATYTESKETYHTYYSDASFAERLWDKITGSEEGYYTYEIVKKDTRVYVFDMDMNMVGSVGDLGVGEELKSASFSGNMAYVVTFRQTDPLYAVDLSTPSAPVVLDELKINGFSTYMQSWGDGLLLGFGQDADDFGRITGVRLSMFDNSDPNNLMAADVYTWGNDNPDEFCSSIAVWDRKALLIAPEKNLIGVPIEKDSYNDYYSWSWTSQYVFLSFEEGKFTVKGDISVEGNDWADYTTFKRAIYIDDYVYALSDKKFVAADINTLEITDELHF